MRIVFMGSAPLACPSLETLLADDGIEMAAAVTQPDRPQGRGRRISSCAVKDLASNSGATVLTPENVNAPDSLAAIKAFEPDLIIVVAYGQILRPGLLAVPKQGCVNMHASLLPKYRGAAPIQWAIANGETLTGVTAVFMGERIDDGDIILQKEIAIDPDDTAGSLHDRLAKEGAAVLAEAVENIRMGRVTRTPQTEAEATFAPKLSKKDGRIDWTRPAEEIYNRVRGFNPWPVCWCLPKGITDRAIEKGGARLRVLKVCIEDAEGGPGEVMDVSGDGPLVAAGDKAVRLLEVQPEGHKVMNSAAYLHGHAMQVGDIIQ